MVSAANAEFAAGIKGAGNYDAILATQEIRTDPATVSGVGYVHPVQADVGAPGGDFVAIGTANGVGVSACLNDYDPKWSVYKDWVLGGVYKCFDLAYDVYGIGGKPVFKIQYGTCPSSGAAGKWVLFWNNAEMGCLTSGANYSSRVVIALETTGGSTVDRNIDAKYTSVYYNLRGDGVWYNFGTCTLSPSYVDPNYSISAPSTTSCNVYLAPLD